MYADFFKDSRPRYNNPTFRSNLVQSTMIFPYSKYEIVKQDYLNSPMPQSSIIRDPNPSNVAQASQNFRNESNLVDGQDSREMIRKFPSMSFSTLVDDPYQHRRSKSHLSSYGSSSLGKLPKVSDKNVFESQQKDFNIVSLCPKEYKQSIKMFPKFRNEIIQDSPNKARSAFISGKPQIGLAYSRQLKQSIDLTRNYKSTGQLNKNNPEVKGN